MTDVKQSPLVGYLEQSSEIGNLLQNMAKVSESVGQLEKDATNPFHKNKYVTLGNILGKLIPACKKHNIFIIQTPVHNYGLRTRIHDSKSGEWIETVMMIKPEKVNAQGVGASITYMKRYALAAAFMLNTDSDDDGNEASGKKTANDNLKMTMTKAANLLGDNYKLDAPSIAAFLKTNEDLMKFHKDIGTALQKRKVELASKSAKKTAVKK